MFNFKYIIDNKVFKDLPINIFCNQLSLENIFISVQKNVLKNISEVFNSCNLEIIGLFVQAMLWVYIY